MLPRHVSVRAPIFYVLKQRTDKVTKLLDIFLEILATVAFELYAQKRCYCQIKVSKNKICLLLGPEQRLPIYNHLSLWKTSCLNDALTAP